MGFPQPPDIRTRADGGTGIVLTAIVIGSSIAASIETGTSGFRSSLSDAALVLYVAASAVAVLLVVGLLWRLVRPDGRGPREI